MYLHIGQDKTKQAKSLALTYFHPPERTHIHIYYTFTYTMYIYLYVRRNNE